MAWSRFGCHRFAVSVEAVQRRNGGVHASEFVVYLTPFGLQFCEYLCKIRHVFPLAVRSRMILAKIERYQAIKATSIRAFVAASCLWLFVCGLRFVHYLDDMLSGRPQYLRWITERTAEAVAVKTNREFPVLVRQDETYDCDKIRNMLSGDTGDVY